MEMLLKKEMGTAKIILGVISFLRYSLAYGPEGETLEGRKMAMARTGGAVNERGSMPTLLSETNKLGIRRGGVYPPNWRGRSPRGPPQRKSPLPHEEEGYFSTPTLPSPLRGRVWERVSLLKRSTRF